MKNNDFGLLLTPDIKLQRSYFKQMCKLRGVNVEYFTPQKNKQYNLHGELESDFNDPETVACIFEEIPNQQTMKKMGWDAELQESSSIIHLPFDLHDLQVGCMVSIPSAYDNSPNRIFRITKLLAKMVYPASISCEIVPEYEDTMEKAETEFFVNTNFNLLNEENN